MTIEYRQVAEMRATDPTTLHGLVTPFNSWTTIGNPAKGGFRERIAPGAFTKTLQERDVVLVHSHNTAMPMARTSITAGPGSLSLRQVDGEGLKAQATPVQTSYAKDVMLLADAGVIRGMSFGFEVLKDHWTDDEGRDSNPQSGTQRTIQEVRLHEVTTTAFPAYTDTQLSARDAVADARDARAAKASYADVNTCADCGATDQYGSYCSGCGGDMTESKSKGKGAKFCQSCGGKMPKRGEHTCNEEQREGSGDAILDVAAQLLTIYNGLPDEARSELDEALLERGIAITPKAEPTDVPEPASTTQDERDDDAQIYGDLLRVAANLPKENSK